MPGKNKHDPRRINPPEIRGNVYPKIINRLKPPEMKPKHPDFLETISKVLIVIVVLLSLVMAATIIFPDFKFYLEYLYI
jgi:hypothetical protein